MKTWRFSKDCSGFPMKTWRFSKDCSGFPMKTRRFSPNYGALAKITARLAKSTANTLPAQIQRQTIKVRRVSYQNAVQSILISVAFFLTYTVFPRTLHIIFHYDQILVTRPDPCDKTRSL